MSVADAGTLTITVGTLNDDGESLFINGAPVAVPMTQNSNIEITVKYGDAVNFVTQPSNRDNTANWDISGTGVGNIIRNDTPKTCACIVTEQNPTISISRTI